MVKKSSDSRIDQTRQLDTAHKCYESARQEILLRIRLRDQILLVYLAISGTVLGISIRDSKDAPTLLAVPFIALGAAILLAQHNLAIGWLGRFCADEIGKFLTRLEPRGDSPQWDNSESFRSYSGASTRLRSWGQSVVLLTPCVLSLAANWEHALRSAFPFGPLWWFGALCFLLIIILFIHTHLSRMNNYKSRWDNNDG